MAATIAPIWRGSPSSFAHVTHLAAQALRAGDIDTFLDLLPQVAQAENLAVPPPAARPTGVGDGPSLSPTPVGPPSCRDCGTPLASDERGYNGFCGACAWDKFVGER